jgi:hypothetical protein
LAPLVREAILSEVDRSTVPVKDSVMNDDTAAALKTAGKMLHRRRGN